MFLKAVVPLTFPPVCSSVLIPPHSCQHFSSVFSMIAIPIQVRWDLILGWVYNSLMANDTELLFMCLLATYMSYFWRNAYSNPFTIFKSDHLSFCSLYSLGTRTLSDLWFATISSHSVGYLNTQKNLIFRKSNLSTFSFVAHASGILPNKPLPCPRSRRFSPMSFWVL